MSILTVQETKNSEKEIREKRKSKYPRQESDLLLPPMALRWVIYHSYFSKEIQTKVKMILPGAQIVFHSVHHTECF